MGSGILQPRESRDLFLTTGYAVHVVGFKKRLKILVVLMLVILQRPGGVCKGWVACRSQSFTPGE